MFVSGPFIQHKPYSDYEKEFRWGVNGAADARAKVQKLVDAGVDVIKLIDQDQMTEEEVKTVVETAHKGGKPVVAHAHREDEIRLGLSTASTASSTPASRPSPRIPKTSSRDCASATRLSSGAPRSRDSFSRSTRRTSSRSG